MTPSYEKINNICLLILAGTAIILGLMFTRPILVPFVISLFLYSVMLPMIQGLKERWKLPHVMSVLITLSILVLSVLLITFFVISSVEGFLSGSIEYRARLLEFLNELSAFTSRFGYTFDAATLRQELRQVPVLSLVRRLGSDFSAIAGYLVLVIVFTFFLVLGSEQALAKGQNQFTKEIFFQVSRYLRMKTLMSVATGVLVGAILGILGVDLAFMFALLATLLNFIPSLGSIAATALPLPIVLLQYGMGWQFMTVLALTGGVQLIIGNLIEPKLMGESMDLHPITILIFLMFWGLVWGIPGMFMAVPITAVVRIVLLRIENTRTLAEILAGRFPRTEP